MSSLTRRPGECLPTKATVSTSMSSWILPKSGQDVLDRMREEVAARHRAMEQMIHRAARILSLFTHYTSVVMAPRISETAVRRLHLTPLDEINILAVVVTEPGFVENHVIELPAPMDEAAIANLEDRLNRAPGWQELERGDARPPLRHPGGG